MTAADLHVDLVELTPWTPPATAAAPLREMAFRRDAWSTDEVGRLRTLFAANENVSDIADALERPLHGVRSKIWEMGLRRNCTRPWGELEDSELARRYGFETAATIAQDLGRAPSAIYARAQVLGLTETNPPPYEAWEDAQIRTGYQLGVPVAQIAALIGRPFSGVISRAATLGARHAAKPDDWTDEEAARALELANEGILYLAIIERLVSEGFPRRTKNGFGQRLRKLGYGRGWGRDWTPDEDELLRRAYQQGASLTPLRERLGRTAHSIRWRAGHLGLRGTHKNKAGWRTEPAWRAEEDDVLRAKYGKAKPKDIAVQLGRTKAAVYCRAFQLGLDAGWCKDWTPDEDKAIAIAWRRGIGLTDLALAFDRDGSVVHKRAKTLGLPFGSPDRPVKPRRLRRAGRAAPTLAEILALEGESMTPAEPAPSASRPKGRPPRRDRPAARREIRRLQRRIDRQLKEAGRP